MKPQYKHRFLLRCKDALRTGWATLLVAALLLYIPGIQNVALVGVLAPGLSVTLAGPSLGTVLHNAWGTLAVVIPAQLSTIGVLQVIKPPISQFAAIACIGVTSIVIAYLSQTHILGRKYALAQTSIVYISAYYASDFNVLTFPLKMLVTDALGVGMAIVATLLPFPRLGVREVRASAESAAHGSSELFSSLMKTISAPDPSTFGSMHLHSKVLAKASMEALADLKKKQVDLWWELGGCGTRLPSKRLTKGLTCLNLHLIGMEMALESGYILYTPVPLRSILRGTLIKAIGQCKSLLDIALNAPGLSSTLLNEKRLEVIKEGRELLTVLDTAYRVAREQAFYTRTAKNSSDLFDLTPNLSLVKHQFWGRLAMPFFVFNLRLYLIETMNLASASHMSANKMHHLVRIGPSMTNVEDTMDGHINNAKQDPSFDPSTSPAPQPGRKSGVFFLHPDDPIMIAARSSSAGLFSPRPLSCPVSRQSSHKATVYSTDLSLSPGRWSHGAPMSRQSSHRASVHSETWSLPQAPEAEVSEKPTRASTGERWPSVNFNQGSGHRQCIHKNADATKTIIKTPGRAGVRSSSRNLLRRLGLEPSRAQTKRSLKTALEIVLATVFGVFLLRGQTKAFWAPVTVSFIIGNFQGGSWLVSTLRLQGIVLGSMFGFLALRASNNHKWAILLLLTPWIVCSSYVRYSPAYGYSGIVAAFTAAVLMLGGFQSDITSFAFNCITENFVGILCFVFVETVIFPERAVVLVRQELVSNLASLRDCVEAIVSVYTEEELGDCPRCRSLAVTEIKQLEQRMRASLAKQTVLSKEAALEPDLWFVPFPAEVYSKLIAIQGRMLDLLYFMMCSLHATMEDSIIKQIETLLNPLRTSFTELQEEVVASLDFFQEVLRVKPVRKSGNLNCLKRWPGCFLGVRTSEGDVEQQAHAASPRPHDPLLMLGRRHRSVDGTLRGLKDIMDSFEKSFEEVIEKVIASIKADGRQMLSNGVTLSIGSLSFSLYSLLRETAHLEKAVHELLQAESPWSMLDFWDNYSVEDFHIASPPDARPKAAGEQGNLQDGSVR